MEICGDKSELKPGRVSMRRRCADAFFALGGLSVARWMTRRIPKILLYHRFGSDDEGRRTSAEMFEQQVTFLKRHCRVLSMAELGELISKGSRIPDNTAVITVDDGYLDFYAHAFPILRKHGLPATFYVTTGFIDRKLWLWPDKVAYMLENTKRGQGSISIYGRERPYNFHEKGVRRKLWVEICQNCLSLGEQDKNNFLDNLAGRLDVHVPTEPPNDCAPASWDQLREMSQAGIEIGAHTITHSSLVKIPDKQLEDEIIGARHRIEEMIGKPVVSFAYPNGGKQDYDERVKRVIERGGYLTAAVAFPEIGTVGRFEIGRYSVGCGMREFQIAMFLRGAFGF